MPKFNEKYRIETIRLADWDYSKTGYYFVTLCTKNRKEFFGKIADEKMFLSKVGKIIAEEWKNTEKIRTNVYLDEWVIMPNHLHGIITLVETPRWGVSEAKDGLGINVETPRWGVSLPNDPIKNKKWKPNSLSSIIGQFKSVSTKRIWKEGYRNFAWQSRFYEHIIRNEKSLEKIREYIFLNPLKWDLDKENPMNFL